MAKYLNNQHFQFLTVPENPKSAFLLTPYHYNGSLIITYKIIQQREN